MIETEKPSLASADGTYHYRWSEKGLRKSTFFVVQKGKIESDAQCPAAQFGTFDEFSLARMMGGWEYAGDQCLQVLRESDVYSGLLESCMELSQMPIGNLQQERQSCERYAASSENYRRFPNRVTDARNRIECIDVEISRRKQSADQ
jgi:hypothetical protein